MQKRETFNVLFSMHVILREQAEAIGRHIPCVIGMSTSISDEAAIKFAISFYRALADGRSVGNAFEFGINDLDLQDIPEGSTPKLKCAPNVDPTTIILAKETNPEPKIDALSSLEINIRELLNDASFTRRTFSIITRRQQITDDEAYDTLKKLGATKIKVPNDDKEYWGLPKRVIENFFEKSKHTKRSFKRIQSNFLELSDDELRNILRDMKAQAFESEDGTELWKL